MDMSFRAKLLSVLLGICLISLLAGCGGGGGGGGIVSNFISLITFLQDYIIQTSVLLF